MINNRRIAFTLNVFLILSLLLISCSAEIKTQPVLENTSQKTEILSPVPPTPTMKPGEATETHIRIDGKLDDWAEREVLIKDPPGDTNHVDMLDFENFYAFINQQALYFMIEVVDPLAEVVQIDIHLITDERRINISWKPGETIGFMGDETNVYSAIGPTEFSSFSWGSVLEARIDLRDIGSPKNINIDQVSAMAGECCQSPAWFAADEINPDSIPVVNEYDPPGLVSDEEEYALARRFNLPDGYVAERLLEPPLPDSFALAVSESGIVYHQHVGISAGLSLVDVETGEVTRILDFPAEYSMVVNGPGDTVFIKIGDEIWQVSPDGSYSIWGEIPEVIPHYYSTDGRLIGCSDDKKYVVEIKPDGDIIELASGFEDIYELVVSKDNVIFVTDWETGNLTRVDSDGTQQVLQEKILYHDPLDLGFDLEGNLYLSTVTTGFVRVDQENGNYVEIYDELSHGASCINHPADFIFISPTRVLFQDPGESEILWFDVQTREYGLLVDSMGCNSFAIDIGPDGALYVGASGCGETDPAYIFRLADDGDTQVVLEWNIFDRIDDLALDDEGGIYIISFGALYYIFPDQSEILELTPQQGHFSVDVNPISGNVWTVFYDRAVLNEFSLDGLINQYTFETPEAAEGFSLGFGHDGTMYVGASETENMDSGPYVDRWVMEVNPDTGQSKVIAEVGREGCCCGINLNADINGQLWVMGFPDFKIWKIAADQGLITFADNLPIDSAAAICDGEGDVYFTSPSGIFRLYQEH